MTAVTPVYCDPKLKELAWDEAERLQIPLSEFFARCVAQVLGRPDLAPIPRHAPGPKRKKPSGNGKKAKVTA